MDGSSRWRTHLCVCPGRWQLQQALSHGNVVLPGLVREQGVQLLLDLRAIWLVEVDKGSGDIGEAPHLAHVLGRKVQQVGGGGVVLVQHLLDWQVEADACSAVNDVVDPANMVSTELRIRLGPAWLPGTGLQAEPPTDGFWTATACMQLGKPVGHTL